MAGEQTVAQGCARRRTRRAAPPRASLLAAAIFALGISAALAVIAAPARAASTSQHYAALGDSYTSGPLIPSPVGPVLCTRSDHNYPNLAAPQIGTVSLRDASCDGAALYQMLSPRKSIPLLSLLASPPQFDVLGSGTDIVTVQLGANDTDLVRALLLCSAGSLLPTAGTPCRDQYVRGGVDTISAKIIAAAPKLAAVIRGIYALAPHARVLVLGYPDILPRDDAGCANVPLTAGDIAYLRDREEQLNATISTQATASGAEYVDLYTSSLGHDACRPAGTRWIEGLLPGSAGFPTHPNELEMQDAARQVVNTLAHPAPQQPPACPARQVTLSLRLRHGERLVRAVLYVEGLRVRTFRGRNRRRIAVPLAAGAVGYAQVRVTVRAHGRKGTRRYTLRVALSRCPPG